MQIFYNEAKETFVNADPDLLRQVMINLIENAVKYGKENSDINIDCETPSGSKTILKFSNHCEFISPESLNHLFDRFYRLESSRNRNLGGVGLGLSVVKSIINLHKGDISVKYSPDGIITFSLTL